MKPPRAGSFIVFITTTKQDVMANPSSSMECLSHDFGILQPASLLFPSQQVDGLIFYCYYFYWI